MASNPAKATTGSRRLLLTGRGNFPPGDGSLAKFGAALVRAKAGGAPAKILIDGHSHVAGGGAGTGAFGTNGCAPLGFAGLLPGYLTAKGLPTLDHSFFGNYAADSAVSTPMSALDSRVALGTGWAGTSSSTETCLGGNLLLTASVNAGFLDFTPGFSFTKARVWYAAIPSSTTSAGVFFDGVLKASINMVNAGALTFADVTGPAATKVSIQNNASGNCYIAAIECFVAGQTVVLGRAGACGFKAIDLAFATNPWNELNGLTAQAAELNLLYILTNDVDAATLVASLQSSMTSIINQMKITGDVILIVDPPGSSAHFTDGTYASYISMMNGLTSSLGCKLIDLRTIFGSTFNAPLMFNGDHPNGAGHDLIAQALAKQIASWS